MLRELDGANDTGGLQPAAEAAADQRIVNHSLVQRQACGSCRRLGSGDHLAAEPHIAVALAHMDCACSSVPWSYAQGTEPGRSP